MLCHSEDSFVCFGKTPVADDHQVPVRNGLAVHHGLQAIRMRPVVLRADPRPFIRVHALLDAMQPYFSDVPILVMYPGSFDGRYVRLFDKLTPNPYYRAFNVI